MTRGLGIRFDSAAPTGGDFDLGTPNEDFGGPGVGSGGEAGQPGQNDVARGGLLIRAENDVDDDGDGLVDDPDDDNAGGFFLFLLEQESCVFGLDLLDVTAGEGPADVWAWDASWTALLHEESDALGANSVERVEMDVCGVRAFGIDLAGSGAIDDLDVCPGGSAEVCDGTDNDGDGQVDEDPDGDGDGWSGCGADCDDLRADVHPGAPELCDGLDTDCDGAVPPDEADIDGDGMVACDGDCDDTNPGIHPGAMEICDGLDDDCDGHVGTAWTMPDPDSWTWRGQRMRGHEWLMTSTVVLGGTGILMEVEPGATITFLVYEGAGPDGPFTHIGSSAIQASTGEFAWHDSPPMAIELHAGVTYLLVAHWAGVAGYGYASAAQFPMESPYGQIVSGVSQSYLWFPPVTAEVTATGSAYAMRHVFLDEADDDGDGSPLCFDCDDADAANRPGNTEACDGADNDCDGSADADEAGEVDADSDGVLSCQDCDDGDALSFPGGVETCDGADNDCNGSADADEAGEVDADSDGALSCLDCDDGEPAARPGLPEACDGIDNDCDPATDELVDADGDGVSTCDGDCDDTLEAIRPDAPEACDGIDNDCDPSTLEDVDGDGDGLSACQGDCDDRVPQVFPGAAEVCDGSDSDCDGELPPAEADADADGWLACNGDCDDEDGRIAPDGIEARGATCADGKDNDCDGAADDADADCIVVEVGPLADAGCQWECEGAGIRFGARETDTLVLAGLLFIALVRREPPSRRSKRRWRQGWRPEAGGYRSDR